MSAAQHHLDRLTKPRGSLGLLEEIVVHLAGITGDPDAPVERRAVVIAAGDHGVARRGVSAYPSDVTAQMVANFVAGGGAVNALAATVGARLLVVDVGVAGPIPDVPQPGLRGGALIRARIRRGTADMTEAPAMSRTEALHAIALGRRVVADLRADGVDLLGIGEMGIGNTTAASALAAAFTGASVESVTGRGTGVDEDGRRRKVAAIEQALRLHRPDPADPIGVLAAVGGLEIAALVGVIVEAVTTNLPIVLDGFITATAALVAATLEPTVARRLIAGHRSTEPGHAIVLERLALRPILDLDLRLGEGSGAALAMGVISAAVAVRDGMATFEFGWRCRSVVTLVVLVRHAPTAWSGKRYCGRADPPLSATGRRVAADLAVRLAPTLPDEARIVTSPSRRATATAEAIAQRLTGATIEIDDDWQEADVGLAEGRTFDELVEAFPALADALVTAGVPVDWPEGETAAELDRRIAVAWSRIVESGHPTVVVSHAGPIRIAEALASGRQPAEIAFLATGAWSRHEIRVQEGEGPGRRTTRSASGKGGLGEAGDGIGGRLGIAVGEGHRRRAEPDDRHRSREV